MAYIVILNPLILGGTSAENAPVDVAGGWLQTAQVGAMTGLAAGGLTILFGLVANLPFALAAGLGINSFLAVAVIGDVTWPEAMGLVLVNGLLIVLLAVTGARSAIFNAVPRQLKAAITVGIGLFIAFIGFVDAGFVTRTPGGPPVQLGDGGSITSVPTLVFVVGLLTMGVLAATMLVFTLFFTDFFDAMGTMTGLAKQGGLADADGNFPRIKSALVVEGVARGRASPRSSRAGSSSSRCSSRRSRRWCRSRSRARCSSSWAR